MSALQQVLTCIIVGPGYVIDETWCRCVGIAMRDRLRVSAPRMNLRSSLWEFSNRHRTMFLGGLFRWLSSMRCNTICTSKTEAKRETKNANRYGSCVATKQNPHVQSHQAQSRMTNHPSIHPAPSPSNLPLTYLIKSISQKKHSSAFHYLR
jgi:hypothetical protein